LRPLSRALEGSWRAQDLGAGLWRFEADATRPAQVYLIGVSARTEAACAAQLTGLTIDWQRAGVRLTQHAPPRDEIFIARQAIVHEPLPGLYEALPLERLDPRARRFWSRVFLIVRLPGGRRLLRLLARRRR
jgi:hypothetical protein